MPFGTKKLPKADQLNELLRQQCSLKVSNRHYSYSQSYKGQCCKVLAELSDQCGGNIRPLRKKLDPPNNFYSFKGICASEKKQSLSMSMRKLKTYNISQI